MAGIDGNTVSGMSMPRFVCTVIAAVMLLPASCAAPGERPVDDATAAAAPNDVHVRDEPAEEPEPVERPDEDEPRAEVVEAEPKPEVEPEPQAEADPEPEEPRIVRPFDDIEVHLDGPEVHIRSWSCLEAGFLEQIACSPGTREHESLVVIRAKPSNIHAALLMAGFEDGQPGRWEFDPAREELTLIPPEGDELDVWLRYESDEGELIEEPARAWIREHEGNREFPHKPWVFGGSLFRENPEWMELGEHYVADMTGSIIGLVTFGDEVIGFKEVISDRAAIHEPEWEIDSDHIPEVGTEVMVIIRPYVPPNEHDAESSRSRGSR